MNDKFFSLKSIKMWTAIGGLIVIVTGAGFLRVLDIIQEILLLPDSKQERQEMRLQIQRDSVQLLQFHDDFIDSCKDLRNEDE